MKRFKISMLILSMVGVTILTAAPEVDYQKVDQLLSQIASYKYGDSQEPLVKLQEVIQSVNNDPDALREIEKRILQTLQSEATLAGKQYLCKKIVIIGTDKSVPVLEKMLQKPETIDMARYALEVLPGEAASKALRNAVKKTEGDYKCGVINSIGVRGDEKAVSLLGDLISNKDEKVAIAALTALGNIASGKAETVLHKSINTLKDKAVLEIALDSYLKCADRHAAEKNYKKAVTIYQELEQKKFPLVTRIAAVRGWIIASGEKGIEIANEILTGDDNTLKSTVIGMIPELPETGKLKQMTNSFNNLDTELQVGFLSAVKERGDPIFLSLVNKASQSEEQSVRIAALDALATVGDTGSVILLARAASETKDPEQETARQSLYLMNAEGVNQTIVNHIASEEDPIKIELIYAIGERRIMKAADTVVSLAEGDNAKLRIAAYRALALIATGDQMPQLVSYLIKAQSNTERKEIERALVVIASNMSEDVQKSNAVLKVLPDVNDPDTKGSLYMVLGKIGEEQSLPVLRKALQGNDQELKTAAIRALSEWPDETPKDELLQVAQTSKQPTHKVLALRGYIGLLSHISRDISPEEQVANYRKALDLKPEAQEIRQILSGLMNVRSMEAFKLAKAYLDNEEVKEEAASAVVRIGWSMSRRNPDEVKSVLQKVITITTSESTKDAAENILNRINNR